MLGGRSRRSWRGAEDINELNILYSYMKVSNNTQSFKVLLHRICKGIGFSTWCVQINVYDKSWGFIGLQGSFLKSVWAWYLKSYNYFLLLFHISDFPEYWYPIVSNGVIWGQTHLSLIQPPNPCLLYIFPFASAFINLLLWKTVFRLKEILFKSGTRRLLLNIVLEELTTIIRN